jgi:purine-nucleoside phosphorylase
MSRQLNQTLKYIREQIKDFKPEVGIILGTGLARLVDEIEIEKSLMYAHIPNFSVSTVEFHSGKLIFGTLNGKKVVAMQGRLHYYEGYSMHQITFPVRVLKQLGIERLFVSNASGSLNPDIKKGDLVCLDDHIDLLPDNPLRGTNTEYLGPRFPDMSRPYDAELIAKAMEIGARNNITIHKGVYVATSGPNLETRAEYRYMRLIGGDVVGMSTVPEIIVANHMSLPAFAISVVTDEGFHEDLQPVSFEDIVEIATKVEPKMTMILKELIAL